MTLRFAPLALCLALCLPWRAAHAAPSASDKATAQTLFDDALKLLANKRFKEACAKLEESDRLDPAMGTKYRLAECYEKVGRTASAWALFREVADEARAATLHDREKKARERAAQLETKLAKLSIVVDATTAGLKVRRNGDDIGEGQWSTPVPIDPGTHTIEASAPGKAPWSTTVEVNASENAVVHVPALKEATVEKPASEKAVRVVPDESLQKPIALGLVGVSVVSLGVSTALVLSARSLVADARPHCGDDACDPRGLELRDSARNRGNLATVFFGAGLLAGAAGAILYLTSPSSNEPTTPRVAIGAGFMSLEGRF